MNGERCWNSAPFQYAITRGDFTPSDSNILYGAWRELAEDQMIREKAIDGARYTLWYRKGSVQTARWRRIKSI